MPDVAAAPAAAIAPPRKLTRHPDFLKLWIGQTISQAGSQVTQLAVPFIAATLLKVSPFEFGLIGMVEFLPFVFLSLPVGVWVDRMARRPILIVADATRGIVVATIPIAWAFGALTIWQLYAVGFVNGCLTVFFDVAYQSYLPSLVGRDQLVDANSKLETTRSSAQIVGPGISGAFIGIVGAPVATVLDSISYLVSTVFMLAIRRPEPVPERTVGADGSRPSVRTEALEGLRYVLGQPYLRAIAACTGLMNLFSNIAIAIYLLFLVRELEFSAAMLGFMFSIGSMGFLVGALTASRLSDRFGVGATIIGAAALFGPPFLVFPFVGGGSAFAIVSAATFVTFGAGTIYNIGQVSLRQAITPERMQGRMNATMRFIVWGTIPLGLAVGGLLGGIIGLRPTILVGAIGSLLPFLVVLFSPVRTLHRVPEPAVEPAA